MIAYKMAIASRSADSATFTAEGMDGQAPRELGGAEYNRIEVDHHHVHLPELADCGLIDWDGERHVITESGEVAGASELIDPARPSGSQRDGSGKED